MNQGTRRRFSPETAADRRAGEGFPATLARATPVNLCGLAILIGTIVYWRFLSFDRLLIYRDIGVDTLNIAWPMLVAHTRGIMTWTFQSGLGQNIFSEGDFDPLTRTALLLGPERVVFALPYLMIIRSTLAAVLAYLFLAAAGASPYAAFLGGAAYAYCGLLVLVGNWSSLFANAAIVAVLLLYAVERFLRGRPLLVSVAAATIALTSSFHLVFFSFVTLGYLAFRLALQPAQSWRSTAAASLRLTLYFALGVALSAGLSIPEVTARLANPRFSTGGGSLFRTLAALPPWQLPAAQEFATAVTRFFGNDLTGTGNSYTGWKNAMEAPAFYTGLIMLVALPQAFFFANRRRRVLYGLLTGTGALYVCFPFFRHLLSVFMGDYYRVSALLVTLVILFLGAQALSGIETSGKLNRPLLWATTGGLSLVLLLAHSLARHLFRPGIVARGGGLLVAATILFMVLHAAALQGLAVAADRRRRWKTLLVLLVISEACAVAFISVNDRTVLPASYLHSGTEYYDDTHTALAAIRAADPTFFRVEKVGYSVFLNDSLFQGYNGTRTYHPFNNPSYIAFLQALEVPFYFPGNTAYIDGFGKRYLLNTLVSVKYLLASQPVDVPGYVFRTRRGAAAVYENSNALPFGFTCDTVIPADDFLSFSPGCRDLALLLGFVASPESRSRLGAYDFKPLPEDASCGQLTAERYAGLVGRLSAEHLEITKHDETSFSGSISVSRDKMLLLTIPFDRGWSLTINGAPAPIEKVDIGFSGVPLHPGTYSLELRYSLPGSRLGGIVSGIGLLVLLALLASGAATVPAAIAGAGCSGRED